MLSFMYFISLNLAGLVTRLLISIAFYKIIDKTHVFFLLTPIYQLDQDAGKDG